MFRKIFISVLAITFPFCVFSASSITEDEGLDLLDQENQIFAASRYYQSLEKTPANVNVLTREDIQKFGYRNIVDALLSLPSVYNASNLAWPTLGIRGFAIPGDFNSRFIILINGLAMSEPIFGGLLIEYIDIETIEKIEFIRGPGSAMYGSGAALGVINLITRSGFITTEKMAALTVASQATSKAFFSFGQEKGGVEQFHAISILHSEGHDAYFPEYDRPPQLNGNTRGNNDLDRFRLFGRVTKNDSWLQWHIEVQNQLDPQASYSTVFDNAKLVYKDRMGSFEAGRKFKFDEDGTFTVRGFMINFNEVGEYPYSRDEDYVQGSEDFIFINDAQSLQYGSELNYEQYLSGHHIVSGVEIKRVEGYEIEGFEGNLTHRGLDREYWQSAIYFQDEYRIGRQNSIFAGGRYDYFDSCTEEHGRNFGRFSPKLAFVHEFSLGTSAKLLYGESFRKGTLFETFYSDNNFSQIRNPGLAPEIARTIESIFEHRINRGISYSLSAFASRIDNSIVAMDVSNTPECLTGHCKQYQNIEGALKVRGLEATLSVKRMTGFRVHASITTQRAVEPPSNDESPASPQSLFKMGVAHPLPFLHADGALEIRHVGHVHGIRDQQSGERTSDIAGYWLINTALSTRLLQNEWRLAIRIDNIFNQVVYAVAPLDFAPIERISIGQRTTAVTLEKSF